VIFMWILQRKSSYFTTK